MAQHSIPGQIAALLRTYRAPDLVIVVRVALAFAVIALYSLPFPYTAAALVLTVVVISMDGLDGYLARKLGMASDLGGVFDITADRIVEHVFWIFFAVAHRVPIWVPIVIVTRSFVVDAVRSVALASGKTAFGEKTMMRSGVTRFLVASRFMRAVYGVAKVAAFVLLGAVIVVQQAQNGRALALPSIVGDSLEPLALGVVSVAVILCVLRGMPVVWDSRRYLSPSAAG